MRPVIRPIRQNEIRLLTDFLYEAIYQPDNKPLLPRTVIRQPELWIYIDRFGEHKGDRCMVAEVDGLVIGAVWTRLIHACGFVDKTTPELAISIYPPYRRKGIGTRLIQEIFRLLKQEGYKQVSLSVSKENEAVHLYLRIGFHVVEEREEDYLMVCSLIVP